MLDPRKNPPQEVYVWDPFVRIAHWALVISVAIAYLVEQPRALHVYAGYAAAALIAARIAWGFVGTGHARFAEFVYPPLTVFRYVRDLLRLRQHERYTGHSPGGGYVILSMLALLVATVLTGIAAHGRWFDGWETLDAWHEGLAYAALGVIAVHIAGVLLRSFVYGQNLIRAQFTGYKRP